MSTGMTYGEGIYFSTEMNISCEYSQRYSGWINGNLKHCAVVAICEIFTGNIHYVNESYLVVPPENENNIAIRYLIVFNNGDNIGTSLKISNKHMLSSKTDLCNHYDLLTDQYIQEEVNRSSIHKRQCLVSFHKRRARSRAS
eukprot:Gb_25242 [translate_table: standard]